MKRIATIALGLMMLAPRPGPAQSWTLSGGAAVSAIHVQSDAIGVVTRGRGTAFGGTGSVRRSNLELQVHYLEGTLEPEGATAVRRDIVQGGIALAFHVTPWLTLASGWGARAYVTPGVTERWAGWQAGARAESQIIAATVRGYIGLWQALSVRTSITSGSGSGRGGEVGMTLSLPRQPLWLGVAYGIDRASLTTTTRRETVDRFAVTLGVGRP